MERFVLVWIILMVIAFGVLCYSKWELKGMGDNLKIIELHKEIVDNYEKRIKAMQELIDYNENVVQNAIWLLYERWGKNKALDFLKDCYIIGDEIQYEEMENCDCDECISRDENAYEDIWGD